MSSDGEENFTDTRRRELYKYIRHLDGHFDHVGASVQRLPGPSCFSFPPHWRSPDRDNRSSSRPSLIRTNVSAVGGGSGGRWEGVPLYLGAISANNTGTSLGCILSLTPLAPSLSSILSPRTLSSSFSLVPSHFCPYALLAPPNSLECPTLFLAGNLSRLSDVFVSVKVWRIVGI